MIPSKTKMKLDIVKAKTFEDIERVFFPTSADRVKSVRRSLGDEIDTILKGEGKGLQTRAKSFDALSAIGVGIRVNSQDLERFITDRYIESGLEMLTDTMEAGAAIVGQFGLASPKNDIAKELIQEKEKLGAEYRVFIKWIGNKKNLNTEEYATYKHIISRLDNVKIELKAHIDDYSDNIAKMEKIRARLFDNSSIEKDQAKIWADSIKIDKKMKQHTAFDVRESIAEFYQLTNGAIGNSLLPLSVKREKSERSSANVEENSLDISDDAGKETVFHELAHLLEQDKETIALSKAFLHVRSTSDKPEKLSVITGDPYFDDEEMAYETDFAHAYQGKYYLNSTEVVSMILERFSTPEQMNELYLEDKDSFIFGVALLEKLASKQQEKVEIDFEQEAILNTAKELVRVWVDHVVEPSKPLKWKKTGSTFKGMPTKKLEAETLKAETFGTPKKGYGLLLPAKNSGFAVGRNSVNIAAVCSAYAIHVYDASTATAMTATARWEKDKDTALTTPVKMFLALPPWVDEETDKNKLKGII